MAALTQGRRTGVDALRAGAMFASETGHAAEANALIARLPRSARNAQMIAIRDKAAFAAQVQAALANGYGNPGAVRGRLLELAAHPDPDGSRETAIATALLRSGDRDDIPTALSTALAATPQPTPAQRLSYAGLLMQAGRPSASRALVAPLDDAALMPDQRSALNSLRAGAAVQTSDALNNRGETADAYDQLAPALRRDPDNADLNLALGRLYQSASSPRRALAIDEAVLQRDPGNLTARRAAVEAAIQLGELDRAYTLTSEVMTTMPDEPGTWIIAATYQRSIGNDHRALQDLLTARNLRQQQIGVANADPPGQDAPPGQDDSALSPVASNPFRHSAAGQGAQEDFGLIVPSEPAGGAHPGPSGDAMSADIDTQIATLQDSLAPKAQIGAGLRSRSGSAGLDQLQEATVPLTGSFSPGRGRLTATATPTFLNGGDLDSSTASQIQFGTNALGGAKAPGNQTASGVGLDANWAYRWLTVDAGTSPLGFRESNLIGGVELAPALSSTLRLRLTGERRAVTDSVLSYAGTEDARTGQSWGGVTRTRGHAQLELSAAPATFYAGGGYASLQGDNVASNSEIELGAGGAYPFYHTATEDARIGLDLVYFAYDHNLRYFSFGQGGYFSPQSYFAALIPVEYRRKTDGLNWGVGASVGYQTYTEHASNVFPNDPALQAQLESAAAGDSTIPTQYGGKSASGVVGGAHGDVEYRVAPQLVVGSKAVYQRAGDWNEAQGLIYARYSFEGGQP
jgi:cellulose synthase operon protein C